MFTSEPPVSERRPFDGRESGAGGGLIDAGELVGALWRARWLVVLAAVLGAMLAAGYASTQASIYAATTQLLVDPRDLKVVQNEVTPNGLPSESTLALIDSQIAVIPSNDILARVVAAEGLTTDPEYVSDAAMGPGALLASARRALFGEAEAPAPDARRRELMVIEALRRNLSVAREPNSFIVNLTVKSTDPDKAARIAGTVAHLFLDDIAVVQADTARRASEALSSRLSELRIRVVDAERAVETYKAENALIGVGGRLIDDDYIVRMNDQLARARADITALKVRADSMRGASVDDVVKGVLPEELTSEALTRLRANYSQLEGEGAVLRARLGPRHPQRIAGDEAIAAARRAISTELSRIVSAAQTELSRAQDTERGLAAEIDALKAKQVTTSGSFVRLRELEREVEASRAVYEAFLLRARETGEQESINTSNVRVVSEAVPPLDPVGPSRKLTVVAGAIGAGGLTAALVLFAAAARALSRGSAAQDLRRRGEEPRVAAAEAPATAPGRLDLGFQAPTMSGSDAFFRAVEAAEAEPAPIPPPRAEIEPEAKAVAFEAARPAPRPQEDERAGLVHDGPDSPDRRQSLREAIRGLRRSGDSPAVSPEWTAEAEFQDIRDGLDAVRHQLGALRERRACQGSVG